MTTATISTLEAALHLVRLAMKPDASLRDRLTITRLVLRRVCACRSASTTSAMPCAGRPA